MNVLNAPRLAVQDDVRDADSNVMLTQPRHAALGAAPPRAGERMPTVRDSVSENFVDAAQGKRLTFAADGANKARAAIRTLLYAAKHDVFIFSKELPLAIYSPAVFHNIMTKRNAPRVRILADAAHQADDSALLEMTDLIAPKGPIEVRWSSVSSPVHYIIVDKRHVWFEQDLDGEHRIIDVNAVDVATDALGKLEQLWLLADPSAP